MFEYQNPSLYVFLVINNYNSFKEINKNLIKTYLAQIANKYTKIKIIFCQTSKFVGSYMLIVTVFISNNNIVTLYTVYKFEALR